jgi:NitT/TauT family transport system substrate-binding protein
VGVLQFGTINWEMDTIIHHELDNANGFSLEVHNFARKNASAVALQSGAVDIILSDLFWVSRPRSQGKAYVLMPKTEASGDVKTHSEKSAEQLLQNTDQSIGIVVGAVDKNWLLLQAYVKHYNIDLSAHLTPKFAALLYSTDLC